MTLFKNTATSVTILAALLAITGCAERTDLKMVVTAAFVSNKGLPVYDDIATYISKELDWDVSVVPSLSYADADEMLETGSIQVGFICGLPYVNKAKTGSVELLAIPVAGLKAGVYPDVPGYEDVPGKYYSYTIVKKGSELRTWEDIRGATYAINDTGSNSGYNMPRAKLVDMGAKSWEGYFSKVVISSAHEESIRMVARGLVDVSSVDSLVLDYERSIGSADAMGVEVIEVLQEGGAGIPPVVLSAKSDPSLKEPLQKVLLGMHDNPEGRLILERGMLDRFEPPSNDNYDDIRAMVAKADSAGFVDFKP